MSDDHRSSVPTGLEQLVAALGELEHMFGAAGREALPAVQARLSAAMAARDRGDPVAMMEAIGGAMEALARLADRLDPGEAMMMRALADHFRTALLRGDLPDAKQDADQMFARSGARYRKPPV
jgi:hypothetical protein